MELDLLVTCLVNESKVFSFRRVDLNLTMCGSVRTSRREFYHSILRCLNKTRPIPTRHLYYEGYPQSLQLFKWQVSASIPSSSSEGGEPFDGYSIYPGFSRSIVCEYHMLLAHYYFHAMS